MAGASLGGGEKCPECGEELLMKKGRFGVFWGCSAYPECAYTRNLSGRPGQQPEPGRKKAPPVRVEEKCPRCGGELFIRQGKFGSFLGCGGFPKCKFTRDTNPGRRTAGTPEGKDAPPGEAAGQE